MPKKRDKSKWIDTEEVIREWGGGKHTISITKPYEDTADKKVRQIALYKQWWHNKPFPIQPYTEDGKSFLNIRKFNIKYLEDWLKIKSFIEEKNIDLLGWDIKEDIKKLEKRDESEKRIESTIKRIVQKNPQKVIQFLRILEINLDKGNLDDIDITFLKNLSDVVSDVNFKVDSRIVESLKALIPKLSREDRLTIDTFNKLLDDWSLRDVNNLTLWVTSRLNAIDFFKDLITNKNTYELKGEKRESMHNFLEDNSWILGENYELVISNKSLKRLIKQDLEKKDKKHERKRPDFALAANEDKLLIITEIKKPNYYLKLDDCKQLMIYRSIAEKYMGKKFQSFKGFLIGNKLSSELSRNKGEFKNITIKTYTNIISGVEKRYKEILKILDKKKVTYEKKKRVKEKNEKKNKIRR